MKELKRIMQINNYDERSIELLKLAKRLGVSQTRCANADTGRVEENIIIERIQQAYAIQQARNTWIIALVSSIASVLSALAAWTAILINIKLK